MAVEPSRELVDLATNGLRSDAVLTRDRILSAAREVFSARGIDAPLSTVARRAGTSIATLYRRFRTRDDLLTAAFDGQLTACTTALDNALDDVDPRRGLRTLVNQICAMQCADRGFTEAFFLGHPHFDDYRLTRAQGQLATLVGKCQAAGQLRADVTADDIVLLLIANAGLVANTPAPHHASARFAAHLLRAFETFGGDPLPPPPQMEVRNYLHRRGRLYPT